MGVEERLLPDAVAGHEQPAATAVPEREGEHAAQAVHAVIAQFLVEVDDHLRVASGGEAVAPSLELGAQLHVVVDLAVEDHHHAAVLVADGLVARLEIYDGEPLDAESGALTHIGPA